MKKFFNTDVTVSDKRNPIAQCIQLSDNVKLTSWGAVYIKLVKSHLFPSSFCIETKNKVIYIDPVMIDTTKKADYIFITHGHFDHFSIKDIEKVVDEKTIIICPQKVAKKLKRHNIRKIEPDECIKFNGAICKATHAYSLGFPSHPKSNKNVGYILNIDNINIYHTGDTHLIPEIKTLQNIDVALISIDGGNLTMKTDEAASLINQIRPKLVIPMHYQPGENKANEFKKLINEDIEVKIIAD